MIEIAKESINGKTGLIGLLGSPVNHSLSPVIHNAALTALNLNWRYLAFPCNADDLELALKGLRRINCKGLNITIPHKNNALKLCDKIDQLAQEIGAVNTLIPGINNSWDGTNTDVKGFLAPLKEYQKLTGKAAVIIGSGGSAKAVVHALNLLNISEITIITRKKNSLEEFLKNINNVNNLSCNFHGLIADNSSIRDHINHADLIVNTTPVGMNGRSDSNNNTIPLGTKNWESLTPNTILYDLIYTPKPTEWLQLGVKYKCHIIDGLEMLIQQGAASLSLWSGIKEIPIKIMRKAAENSLNSKQVK
ncbi:MULTISPECIES: shikimate dehydrogenase [unclassified Prochlorococcus]|uniref:shikimate dehydrogenase n=1 Tax=unclassified Prochlorococcus TaxID=2627481 RepID=UPI00053397A5|nr:MULTISPECIES: shikimate dehydrogenase [unclassified Prochlorococcus]KGG14510.1 Shikimate 5-dehydrogenase I alpha [Prochlorococcus sp. MIT 0602]KGG16065.1 Shikimate 5-dehydrogenase I alpha [Prochlorococcus sp. MIT 0603]